MSVPVDAIGSVLNPQSGAVTANNSINQDDFIKLFLSQLQFQDPLQPVDNQQFLAQLAEFSNLQQATQTSQNTEGLLVMNSSAQALALLGKVVQVQDTQDTGSTTGTIVSVAFDSSGPSLTIDTGSVGGDITGVRLSQISIVQPVQQTQTGAP